MPCQKKNCWLPLMRNSSWCATCALERQTAIIRGLCFRIRDKEANADSVLHILAEPSMIQCIGYADMLDSILYSMYESRQFTMLRRYLTYIRNTSVLQAMLYLRIRSHTITGMCAVYGWMLRHGMPIEMLPKACFACLTYAFSHSHTQELHKLIRTLDSPSYPTHPLRRLLHTSPYTRLERFLDVIIQYAPVHADTVVKYLVTMYPDISRNVMLHPCILPRKLPLASTTDEQKTLMYTYLARRIESFRDELVEVAWDPSRVVDWCLTTEEQTSVLIH
jgi:hypothetical protein